MVRIKRIIKEGLGGKKKEDPKGEPLVDKPLEHKIVSDYEGPVKPQPPADIEKKEAAFKAPHQLEQHQHVEPAGQDHTEYEKMYYILYSLVEQALAGNIQKEKIEHAIDAVIQAFDQHIYNYLLQLFYSFSKNNYLGAHIVNDVIMTIGFGKSLGLSHDDLHRLGIIAFCHDLGMNEFMEIFKRGVELNKEEIEEIKRHPLRSMQMVSDHFSSDIVAVIGEIHEKENGRGYPEGKPGAEISLFAKIVAICDAYEALTHPRIFRKAYLPYEAMKIIIKKKGDLFDDVLVKRLIDYLSIYPVGSLVSLNSGEIAIVVASHYHYPTRPIVKVLVNANKEVQEIDHYIDLLDKKLVYIINPISEARENELLYFLKPRGSLDLD